MIIRFLKISSLSVFNRPPSRFPFVGIIFKRLGQAQVVDASLAFSAAAPKLIGRDHQEPLEHIVQYSCAL